MSENHINQQKIQNSQNNEMTSKKLSIQDLEEVNLEEVNEADLNAIRGGVLKWCSQSNQWVDDGTYHLMPPVPPPPM